MQLLIRRLGTLVDVSPDGRSPLPSHILDRLEPEFTYDHQRFVRGPDAYDPVEGYRERIVVEPRNLFRVEQGRFTTGYGFIPRLTRILRQDGHDVRYKDLSPPRVRPKCYNADWDNLRANFNPRPRQMECLEKMARCDGGIINATMGFGKTHLFTAICWLYPYAKVAIVVKPKDVAERIVRQLTRHFPNVGYITSGKKLRGDRITVFTAGSMHHSDGDFDILLCDEAHQLMSEHYSKLLGSSFRLTRNFGFTATPAGRMDGAHVKLEMFFGPEIFNLPYPEAVRLGLVVPIRVRWLKKSWDHNPAHNKTGVPRMRWGVWRNQARNQMFAQDARENYDDNTQVLMAVATVDHAIHLWQFLPEFTLCYSANEQRDWDGYKRSGMLPSSFQPITTARREEYRTAFEEGRLKKVIATDVWSTGVDFERLQVLYRCDARESPELCSQWGGRPSRIYEGKEYSEIIDSMDDFDKNMKRKATKRRNIYKEHEWEQDWPRAVRQNHITDND